jgi:hypothetical protein
MDTFKKIMSLPDGEYRTRPRWGPQTEGAVRVVIVKDNKVTLKGSKYSFTTPRFFDCNVLVEK